LALPYTNTTKDMQMPASQLRLGIAGLGRAFKLMLPTFAQHPRILLAGAADPRLEARQRFTREFGARAFASVEDLCADPGIDAVYIATPHGFHVEHVLLAARHGKHVLVEKPMALTLEDCDAMIAAAHSAGVRLLVGHCHSFDAPYRLTRTLIESGRFGRLRMIHALNFTDFLYRPRRPEELRTSEGGGAIFSQAPHQVDIARLLAGRHVRSVRAASGNWDPARPTEGAYSAFLAFDGDIQASLTYSGYGHFDSDELMGWIGEMGNPCDPAQYGTARAQLRDVKSPEAEAAIKNARAYGSGPGQPAAALPAAYNHFGFFLASCEGADLRPMPNGVWVYADTEKHFEALPPPSTPRGEVVDEFFNAAVGGIPPLHDGLWGRTTLEVCLAILRSSLEGREITL